MRKSLVASEDSTLEAWNSGRLNHLFFNLWLTTICVLCLWPVCALLSKRVCGTGKGVTGMLLFRQGINMAQRPQRLFWDVVKQPDHRQILPPVATTNTRPYVGLWGCHPVPGCWHQPQLCRLSEGIRGRETECVQEKQQPQTKPRMNMLAILETHAGFYCLKTLHQCLNFSG